MVSTFAGGGQLATGNGTNVNLAAFAGTSSEIAIDHNDAIYITAGGLLARVGPDAAVSTITNFPFGITGICVDSHNNIFLSDQTDNKVFRMQTNGVLSVFAGSGGRGAADGNGITASFIFPQILACDNFDNIYVADAGNYLLRKIDQNQNVTTISGAGTSSHDGTGTNATFGYISAMSVDAFNNSTLGCGPNDASFPNTSFRIVNSQTNAATLAGSFTQIGYTNGPGDLARFAARGVCVAGGKLFIADYGNQRIRELPFYAQSFSAAKLQLSILPVLTITGTAGGTYEIQTSPDMTTWTTVATILLNSSPFLWVDQSGVIGTNFYRAVLVP